MALNVYKMYKDLKHVDDSEQGNNTETKIQILKGTSNWRSFRDLITMKLSFLVVTSIISVEYVTGMSKHEYRSV